MTTQDRPNIEIRYCPRCKWLARASWYAQEILSTFHDDLGGVHLVPAADAGVFSIKLEEQLILDRKTDGFLEAKEVKRRIRDRIAPDRGLGHIDN